MKHDNHGPRAMNPFGSIRVYWSNQTRFL